MLLGESGAVPRCVVPICTTYCLVTRHHLNLQNSISVITPQDQEVTAAALLMAVP